MLGKDSQANYTPKPSAAFIHPSNTRVEGLKGGLDLPVFTWLPDHRGIGPKDEDALPVGSGLLFPQRVHVLGFTSQIHY